MFRMTRRQVIGSAVLGAFGAAAPAFAMENPFATPRKWDETVDVVVVGAGGAGFAAAITAKEVP